MCSHLIKIILAKILDFRMLSNLSLIDEVKKTQMTSIHNDVYTY